MPVEGVRQQVLAATGNKTRAIYYDPKDFK